MIIVGYAMSKFCWNENAARGSVFVWYQFESWIRRSRMISIIEIWRVEIDNEVQLLLTSKGNTFDRILINDTNEMKMFLQIWYGR